MVFATKSQGHEELQIRFIGLLRALPLLVLRGGIAGGFTNNNTRH
jgi:hypothetical protein